MRGRERRSFEAWLVIAALILAAMSTADDLPADSIHQAMQGMVVMGIPEKEVSTLVLWGPYPVSGVPSAFCRNFRCIVETVLHWELDERCHRMQGLHLYEVDEWL